MYRLFLKNYLHDDEKDERDEDVDLRVLPGVMVVVADVVELLRHTLAAPCAVVKQRHQRLVLRQLTDTQTRKNHTRLNVSRRFSSEPDRSAEEATQARQQRQLLSGFYVYHQLVLLLHVFNRTVTPPNFIRQHSVIRD